MPFQRKNKRHWYYTVGNSLYEKISFNSQMFQVIEKSFTAFRETQITQIRGYTFNFPKMICVYNSVPYYITNDNGQWRYAAAFYPEGTPFNPEMNQQINFAYKTFKDASKKQIYFVEFDFERMECTFNSVTYKITFVKDWAYYIRNELHDKIFFDYEYNKLVDKAFDSYIAFSTKDIDISGYTFNFAKMKCIVNDKKYALSYDGKEWAYSPPNDPGMSTQFAPDMNKSINDAYNKIKDASRVPIKMAIKEDYSVDTVFDFEKMEYTFNNMTYKLSNNAIPYEILRWDRSLNDYAQTDRSDLDKFDSTKVVHRWFWWDGDLNHFSAFKGSENFESAWRRYPLKEEKEIEKGYQANPRSTEPIKINDTFCVIFNTGRGVMLQGRNDEMDKSIEEEEKHSLPITRAAFCWCYDSNEKREEADWVAYDAEVSEILEDAFIDGVPEVEITVGTEKCCVNFSQGIQFSLCDTSKKCRITRYGTRIRDLYMTRLCWNYQDFNDMIPNYWDKYQTSPVILSTYIKFDEYRVIKRLVDLSNSGKNQHKHIHCFFIFNSLTRFFYRG